MVHKLKIRVLPDVLGDDKKFRAFVSRRLSIPQSEIKHIEILHKSIDARQKLVQYELSIEVYQNEIFNEKPLSFPIIPNTKYSDPIKIGRAHV